ncbi:MAG TPA: response regulator [Opitutaceae bacterium]|nr:response regulator [Opitutaceae bacterium]
MSSNSRPPIVPRVLHLEDNPADAELVSAMLLDEWSDCHIVRVQTEEEFAAALRTDSPDLILSDFSLPGFNGLAALGLAHHERPDVPFIFLSGTIGEDNAVEALQRGATDYVLKDRPARLIPAIRRALAEAREATRRRAANQRLREQAALLDKAQDAIYVRDLDDRVLYWNRSAERIFGYTAAEALGQRSCDLKFRDRDKAPFFEGKRLLLEQGDWTGEFRVTNKAGLEIDVLARWTLVRDERDAPKHILCIDTDVTEQRRLEKQYLRAQRLESLGALAGGIAHDLNNALAPILMSAELLQQKATDAATRRMCDILIGSAQHGAALVKQVLTFARGADGGRAELQPKLTICDVARLLRETLPRSIAIEADVPNDLWSIRGDATQLHQVLVNLCVNARDAMPDGGRLTMRATNVAVDEALARGSPGARTGPHVLITVADTGTGIPPEILGRIFDPFFTTKEPGRGTGLGLATVLAIVKSHQGFLQINSELQRGTEFKIYFPALVAAAAATARTTASAMPFGQGELILIIDDEESIRTVVRSLLEACGYRTHVEADGHTGVDVYRRRRAEIAAVATDLMMPGMQGGEVIAALQAINPDVRIVAMSGLLEAEPLKLKPEPGRLALLKKPMAGEELLRAVKNVLTGAAASAPQALPR